MPNIRSQSVSKDGIDIVASDGRTFSITRAQILAIYQAQTGNAASRKQKAITAVIAQMVAALGEDQVDALLVTWDFDPADSTKSLLMEIRSG